MSGCLCIRWPGGAYSFLRIMLRRVQTAAMGLCRGVYVFHWPGGAYLSCGLCSGVCRQPQWAYVGGFMYFIGWVAPVLQLEMCHIIHAEMLSRLFMGFSAGSLCIFNRNATTSQSKLYPILHARHYPSHNLELPSRAL